MTALEQLKKLSEALLPVWHGQPALKSAIVAMSGSFTHDQYHAGCDAIRNERNAAQDEIVRLRAALNDMIDVARCRIESPTISDWGRIHAAEAVRDN